MAGSPFNNKTIDYVVGDKTTAYTVSSDGSVFRSKRNQAPELVCRAAKAEHFVATAKGVYLLSGQTLYRSDRTGKRWSSVELPTFSFIDISKSGTVFIQTEDGISYSKDGGKRFARANAPSGFSFYSMASVSKDTLFIAGHWVILVSKDGGLNWQVAKRAGGSAGVYCEAFAFDEKHILATGQYSSCAVSVDGGATWKAHKHPDEFGEIHCLTLHPDGRLFGLTGTKKPRVVYTTNYGRKWKPAAASPAGVQGIWARADGAMVVVGKRGRFDICHDW